MDVGLGVAGILCLILGVGHETVGRVFALPALEKQGYPGSRLGGPGSTRDMVHVTWHIVTIFVLGLGCAFLTLAFDSSAEPRVVMFRWFAAMWLVAAVMAAWVGRKRLRVSPLLPVPLSWVVIAVLLWRAST